MPRVGQHTPPPEQSSWLCILKHEKLTNLDSKPIHIISKCLLFMFTSHSQGRGMSNRGKSQRECPDLILVVVLLKNMFENLFCCYTIGLSLSYAFIPLSGGVCVFRSVWCRGIPLWWWWVYFPAVDLWSGSWLWRWFWWTWLRYSIFFAVSHF